MFTTCYWKLTAVIAALGRMSVTRKKHKVHVRGDVADI